MRQMNEYIKRYFDGTLSEAAELRLKDFLSSPEGQAPEDVYKRQALDGLVKVEAGHTSGGTGDEPVGLGQHYCRLVEGLHEDVYKRQFQYCSSRSFRIHRCPKRQCSRLCR